MMIGVTERGDAALDTAWYKWVQDKKPAILISKNPVLLCERLDQFENPNVIVNATITGYGETVLEPNVINYTEAIEIGLKNLVKKLGAERIVLRIDPIVPTEKGIQVALDVLNKAQEIGSFRVRISFIDNYPHVIKRFAEEDIALPWTSFHAPLELRQEAFKQIQTKSQTMVEICAEPDFFCSGCVSSRDCFTLGIDASEGGGFQRPLCSCLAQKHELLSKKQKCAHGCLYCYWKG